MADLSFGIRITADGKVAVSEVEKVKREFGELTESVGRAGSALGAAGTAAKVLGGVVGGTLVAAVGASVRSFADAESVTQRLAASLDITGGMANRTVGEIDALAQSLQSMTRFGDEGVKLAAASLTKFGSIAGDNFDRALKLSTDLAEALGRDVPEAAQTLGRALENAAGAQMLARLGLLNDSQAQAIKLMRELGDESGAQEALFAALEGRVGGLAERMGAQGLTSAWAQLKNQVGESLENLGKATAEFTNLEGVLRGLTGLVQDFNAGGISKIIDALSGTSFSYGAAFAQGDRSNAAEANKFEIQAQQGGRAANEYMRERNRYLAEQDQAVGELILKEQRHSQAIASKADVVRAVTAAWNNGNTALIGTYGSLDVAIERISAAVVKKGNAAAKAAPQIKSMADAINRAHENAMNWIKSGEEAEKAMLAQFAAASEYQPGLEAVSIAQKEAAKSAEAMVQSLETETALQKLSNVEREIAVRLLQLEATGVQKGSAAYDELAERIRETVTAQSEFTEGKRALAEQERAYKETFGRIGDSITDALLRGFESGTDIAKSFRDTLYNMFRNLVLRPVIQAIVAPVAGGIASLVSGGANAGGIGGLGGGGFDLSSLLGGGGNNNLLSGLVGSLSSGAGAFSLFGGAGASQAALLGAQTGVFGAAGTSATLGALGAGGFGSALGTFGAGFAAPLTTIGAGLSAGAAGGLGAGLAAMGGIAGAIGAAVPIIGIGLAIASALGAFDKSVPKTGGSAGAAVNLAGGGWGLDQRLFTPNTNDAAVRSIVETVGESFRTLAESFGGGRGVGEFLLGYDAHEEHGNRVSAIARAGGREVYSALDVSVGDDPDDINAALELHARRAVLAALQASELPRAVSAALGTVDAALADDAALDSVLALASAFKALTDAAAGDPVADAAKAWEAMQRSGVASLRVLGEEVSRMAAEFDGTTEGANALAIATNTYRQAVAQTIVGIRAAGQEIDAMFGNTREQIEAAGLGREALYGLLQSRAESAMAQALESEDPQQIRQLSQRVNSLFLEIFNQLSAEDQAAQRGSFLDGLTRADEAIGARLESLAATLGTESEGPIARVGVALESASDRMIDASVRQQDAAVVNAQAAATTAEAAATLLAAAQLLVSTPIQVSSPQQSLVNA